MVAEQELVGAAYITAGVASLVFLLPAFSNMDRPGSRGFIIVVAGIAGWSVCNGVNKFVATLAASTTLTKIVFSSAQVVAVGWLLLALGFIGRGRFTRRLGTLVGAYVVGWQSLIWTNHVHHLFLRPTTRMADGLLVTEYSVGFWVFVATTYGFVIAGTVFLIREGGESTGIRREQALILASSLLPAIIGNVITLIPIRTLPYDLTPMGFMGSAMLFLWALYSSRFLEIRPAARKTVLEEIDDAILTIDDGNALVDFNPAAADLFDVDEDDIGHTVTEMGGLFPEVSTQLLESDDDKTEITVTDDGTDRHFQLRMSALNDGSQADNGRVVVIREITSLKRQQQQLREHEQELERQNQLFRNAQEIAHVGAWEYDATSETLTWSAQTYEIHDLPQKREISVEQAIEFYHPEDRQAIRDGFTGAIESGDPYDIEARIQTAADDQRWVRTLGDPLTEDGSIVGVHGTIQDVTEVKRREQELQEQTQHLAELTSQLEQQYRRLFEEAPVMAVLTRAEDGNPVIEDCNRLFAETLGYETEALVGRNLAELYTAESERQLSDEGGYDRALSEGLTRQERTLQTADGDQVETLLRAVPRTDSGEQTDGTLAMYVDISTRRELQREKDRLEELYVSARDILSEDSREKMSEQTVQTVQSVLGFSGVGIHLYDRETEALEPAATTERVRDALQQDVAGYTDRETVVWDVYESGEPVRIDETRTFDGTLPNEDTPTRSAVVVPVGAHGVLITSARDPGVFDDEDVYFLRLLGQFVEIALDRAANDQRLVATQNTVQKTLHAETHEQMADIVLEEIPDALDLPIAGIWKYEPAQRTLAPLGLTENATDLFEEQPEFPAGESLAWRTFETGSTAIVSDITDHPEAYNPETPIRGEIIVPIGEFGVLIAGSTSKSSFTRIDANVLEILAGNIEAVSQIIQQRREINLFDQVVDRILRHNVRNKLTPIVGFADQIVAESEEPTETYAKKIVESSEKLRETSQHAREMRRIVQNIDKMVEVQLEQAVRSAIEATGAEFPDGKIALNVEDRGQVTAHSELETAIRHLIRNGLEHNTSETPRVSVTVTESAAGPTIEIEDNGPGIDADELDVFEEHGESALRHGSGAGLWIVDRVLEYSNALVTFDTVDGTKVTITFPSTEAS